MAKWNVELLSREVKITVARFTVINPGDSGQAVLHITDDEGKMHAVPQSHFRAIDLRRLNPGSVIMLVVSEGDPELQSVYSPEPVPEDRGQLDLVVGY